ncbi:MAG: YbaN family protein [Christensenellales bacterium]|jgi:uncharacterized membrane protein YbaN (DUF454 family)
MKKVILVIVGCIGLGLGAVGAVLPLMPAFPFLLLAAVCFARSSQKLNDWFLSTKLYRCNLESYLKGQGLLWKAKIRVIIMITILMGIGFMLLSKIPVGRIILAFVWLFHIIYFVFIVKTKKEPSVRVQEAIEKND